MSKPINVITDMDTLEVSLVDKGANKKKFAIQKTEAQAMDEIIKAVLDTPVEGEEAALEAIAKAAKSSDKEKLMAAAKAAMRLLSGFKDQIGDDVMEKISQAAGYKKKSEGTAGDEPKEDPMADLPEEVKKQLEPVFKAQEVLKAENAKLQKSLEEEREARLDRELTAKVQKEFAHLGETKEVVSLLKSVSGEARDNLEKVLKAADARVSQGALSELGHSSTGEGSAMEQFENRVAEIKKSDATLSTPQAWDLVMKQEPALYEQYLAEKGR